MFYPCSHNTLSRYPFSLGDLRDSSIVLSNYMENAPPKIPWADLKYLFGEITYGGHIVNDFDRLLANTYVASPREKRFSWVCANRLHASSLLLAEQTLNAYGCTAVI